MSSSPLYKDRDGHLHQVETPVEHSVQTWKPRAWQEVSRRDPCRICGKPGWCSRSTNGLWNLCRRVNTGAGMRRLDRAGNEYWLYRTDRLGDWIPPASTPLPTQAHRRATPDTLDRVYRALLAELPLLSSHREALAARGLTEAEQQSRLYRSLVGPGRAGVARRLVKHFGADICADVPGFYVKREGSKHWWSLAGAVGLLIPVRDAAGRIVALKVRADEGVSGPKYSALSSFKHGGPGPGAQVHIPLHPVPSSTTVRLTEGELKADIATVLSGMLSLSAPGVAAWRLALPVLRTMQAREVFVAFDADWRDKAPVARSLAAAAQVLSKSGYTVHIEIWDPAHGKGIDDVLAAGHMPELQPASFAFGLGVRAQAITWKQRLRTVDAEEMTAWRA